MFVDVGRMRKMKGMTQAQLAAATGMTRLAIGNIETGKTKNPSSKALFAIANALGCKIDDLFFNPDA